MSAHNYYQPHVFIDGKQVSETRDLDGLTPIADIRIKWGTTTWWDNVEASTLSLTIIDPFGELLALERGVSVTVTTDPDGFTLFRGTLDASSATYTQMTNAAGQLVDVWVVEVEAYDALQALQSDRAHGPTYGPRNGQVNRLHWGQSLIRERLGDLNRRSPLPIEFVYESWHEAMDDATESTNGAVGYPMAAYTTQQNLSVLTVLRNTARALGSLYRPYVDHKAGTIRLIRPSTGVNTHSLLADGPVRIIRGTIPSPVIELDGAATRPGSGSITLDLNPQDDVNLVTLTQRQAVLRPPDAAAGIAGTYYEMEDVYGSTVSIGGDSTASVELETDLTGYSEGYWHTSDSELLGSVMRAARGYRAMPPFKFKLSKDGPQTDAEFEVYYSHLFRAHPTTRPGSDRARMFALVNTPLQWGGTLPYFSIVGGELNYTDRDGWIVTCNPATIRRYHEYGQDKTLAQATTGLAVQIQNTRPNLTVADFQVL